MEAYSCSNFPAMVIPRSEFDHPAALSSLIVQSILAFRMHANSGWRVATKPSPPYIRPADFNSLSAPIANTALT
jgi:hypothetical protein